MGLFKLVVAVFAQSTNARKSSHQQQMAKDATAYEKLKKTLQARLENQRARIAKNRIDDDGVAVSMRKDKYQRD